MDLQSALLLIGAVIIAIVVLTSVDRARAAKRLREHSRTAPAGIVRFARDALNNVEDRLKPHTRLDVNPGPLRASGARSLRTDAPMPEIDLDALDAIDGPEPDSFIESLEGFEQMAAMPLDVRYHGELDDEEEMIDVETGETVRETGNARSCMPNEQIDFIISLPGKGPVQRDKALGIYKQNEYMLDKPRSIYGLRYIDGTWSCLDSDPETMQYSDLALAIQLADRHGPIKESELNTFSQLGLKLADNLRRPCKHPLEYEDAMERADALDAFCKQFDAIASIQVLPEVAAGFRGSKIHKAATSLGMSFGPMDIYHRKNNEAVGCKHMFSMANLFEPGTFNREGMEDNMIRGLVLFMQIPLAADPAAAFEEMARVADQLSTVLDGRMQDPDGNELTRKGIKIIAAQIQEMSQHMRAYTIAPGSETALRLFNT
ncbi:MAG: cell division protein ZipA C-terminal FtsZ-binding domain-containing protein [Gammaproteobacteria bacterium]|nr:cell division protein ZipA C-terminal FtsZ-binding domain-containing protein [Gammaproteobacteria bacterium]